jgi:hypothetical protein
MGQRSLALSDAAEHSVDKESNLLAEFRGTVAGLAGVRATDAPSARMHRLMSESDRSRNEEMSCYLR